MQPETNRDGRRSADTMAPRLKVFRWSDGLHDYSVAATSRPKALAAWGFSRDIFREGAAQEISEGADYDAALASPGEVVTRPAATKAPSRPRPSKAPRRDAAREHKRAKALAALDDIERSAAALEAEQRDAEQALDRDRQTLARRAEAVHADFERRRAALDRRREEARKALRGERS